MQSPDHPRHWVRHSEVPGQPGHPGSRRADPAVLDQRSLHSGSLQLPKDRLRAEGVQADGRAAAE
jgi:hypothetical protein